MNRKSVIAAYLRQQDELGLPDIYLGPLFDFKRFTSALLPPSAKAPQHAAAPASRPRPAPSPRLSIPRPAPAPEKKKANPFDRLSGLKPLAPIRPRQSAPPAGSPMPEDPVPGSSTSIPDQKPLSFDEKRAIFTKLYRARCEKCPLAKSRKSFVFGAGNVDAPLMIIGEAPGAEEDEQGMPFVGAAGKLLTELLDGAAIDRKTGTFITNILKCRPPNNRAPSTEEIATCLPLLRKQIEVVSPRALLLLGKTAVTAVLESNQSMSQLRGKKFDYRGIPVFVTYHPSYLLRTPEARAMVAEDLKTVAEFLGSPGASRR